FRAVPTGLPSLPQTPPGHYRRAGGVKTSGAAEPGRGFAAGFNGAAGKDWVMKAEIVRAALRHGLEAEGARSLWITLNVVQAAAPAGGLMTVVRHCDETYESWLARALSSYRDIALRKAA
ncbi:MAG: hypothetical protein AAB227_00900, partial [Pseudomonadota bacterium]